MAAPSTQSTLWLQVIGLSRHVKGAVKQRKERLVISVQDFVPQVAYDPFIVMCTLATLGMIAFSLPFAGVTNSPKSAAALRVVTDWADPAMFSFFSISAAVFLVYAGLSREGLYEKSLCKRRRFWAAVLVTFLLFVFAIVIYHSPFFRLFTKAVT